MGTKEALNIVEQVSARTPLNMADNLALREALQTLHDHFDPPTTEPKK